MIRKTLSVIALAAAFLAGATLAPVAVNAVTDPTTQEHAGCALRGDGGWHIHANGTHECNALDAEPIVQADGDLYLNLTNGHIKVVDIDVEEDETFSKFADCGPSGGISSVIVRCWDKNEPGKFIRGDDPRWDNPLGNLWFSIDWID